jgi:hypothetical protein
MELDIHQAGCGNHSSEDFRNTLAKDKPSPASTRYQAQARFE